EETLALLHGGLGQPHALFAVGDDCEKFGVWPGTYDHCYANGWLERFFGALEGAAEWLEVVTLSDYLAKRPPAGLVYLPTASYAEMMAWALPADATIELEECVEETNHMPHGERFRRFLRGGQWRNFLAKYPESNQTQKLVLRACRRWHELHGKTPPKTANCHMLNEALDHLLAAQCNDAYWHGIFGGLYTPHLRSAVLGRLIQAEQIMDRVEYEQADSQSHVFVEDFDVDGQEEVLLDQGCVNLVARPSDGGTISSLRFKPAAIDLINSLTRVPEAYHRLMHKKPGQAPASGQPASIHDRTPSQEANLSVTLRYDRYSRHSFRAYLFPRHKNWQDFDLLSLDECAELAGGLWKLGEISRENGSFELRKTATVGSDGREGNVRVVKSFTTRSDDLIYAIACNLTLSTTGPARLPSTRLGVEMVFNLLAPNSPDRYFLSGKDRHPLEFRGELAGSQLALVDEWQHVEIALEAPGATGWWVVPIETVSQSESGFERVYQGSAIMAVWDVEIAQQRDVCCLLQASISSEP
ncbi:MAG TPA: alpha-amylase/4-alpha-glucanotransferase domain-containing protein, partial [Terriglobia bacterium]|nr:alpha-amylase/4-alpha-glucanotransferase domain-containing protein [Terriglobia bacterium]